MKINILSITFCIFLAPVFTCTSYSQIDNFYAKAKEYGFTNLDSGLYYYQLLDSAALIEQDSQKLVISRIYLGSIANMKQQHKKAKTLMEEVIPMSTDSTLLVNLLDIYATSIEGFDIDKADSIYQAGCDISKKYNHRLEVSQTIYNNYANFLEKRGDLPKSIEYFTLSLENADTDFQKFQSINSLLNIFSTLENTHRMEDYIHRGIEIAERNNFKSRDGNLALNHAILYSLKGEFENAKRELDRANNYDNKLNPRSWFLNTIHTKKIVFQNQNDWISIDSFLDSEAQTIKKFKLENHALILLTKGEIALDKGQFQDAKQYALKAIDKARARKGSRNLLNGYQLLSTANEKLGNLSESIKYKKRTDSISNAFYSITQSDYVTFTEAKFKRNEQKKEIEHLDNENEIKSKVLAQQHRTIIIGGLSLLFISILFFLLYRLYKKVNAQKETISKALSDKDILLREIHHRVKNNLQLVSSLLTLQGRSINDATAQQAINEGKSRVRSMALIHQDLYNKENLTGVSVRKYLEKLTSEIFSTYKVDNADIDLSMEIDNIELDVDTLVPLGLIINELITNCLKYAFPNGRKGKLFVGLSQKAEKLVLTIKDDGVGYDIDQVSDSSFGSTLITALTEQLEGRLTRKLDNGTQITIELDTQ